MLRLKGGEKVSFLMALHMTWLTALRYLAIDFRSINPIHRPQTYPWDVLGSLFLWRETLGRVSKMVAINASSILPQNKEVSVPHKSGSANVPITSQWSTSLVVSQLE